MIKNKHISYDHSNYFVKNIPQNSDCPLKQRLRVLSSSFYKKETETAWDDEEDRALLEAAEECFYYDTKHTERQREREGERKQSLAFFRQRAQNWFILDSFRQTESLGS